jgi:N6-adenosine-specific RNA methylase IME4/DNA-binding CsgD family transcriptional regulator
MTDKNFNKLLGDHLLNAKGFYDYGIEQKLITAESLRLTIAERQEQVKALVNGGMSQRKAAKALGISQRQVQRDLRRNGSKSEAKRLTKTEKRANREAELAAKQSALPDKRYGVIVADPEWRFEPYSRETGMDRAADNHYPTSPAEVIADRDVASIAADDCVLFLWATVPMLPIALEVMKTWGFEYRSHVTWDKIHIGTGYWFRNRHELLLVGTRGDIPAPAMGTQFPSVIAIARKEHSEKPEQFLELIEQYFPTLPKIELNRRGTARAGWDAWGNEALEAAQ